MAMYTWVIAVGGGEVGLSCVKRREENSWVNELDTNSLPRQTLVDANFSILLLVNKYSSKKKLIIIINKYYV